MINRLRLAFTVTLVILIVEVAGGLLSNSLALLSDAGHVFTDLVALGLSWYGLKQTQRPASFRMTYGYHRVGIFVALVNAATLIAIALVILTEAFRRLAQPNPVEGGLMLVVAAVGLMVNLLVLFVLRGNLGNLNVQSAFLHVVGDTLGSVAVIAGGTTILLTGWYWVDPFASIMIAGIIAFGSLRIIRESVNVLLEATPGGLDVSAVVRSMYGIPGIKDVHDLHIWAITPEIRALSCHVAVEDITVHQGAALLSGLNKTLEEQFGIGHTTIQLECEGFNPNELYCSLGPEGQHHAQVHAH
ncbi:MAG TPA: cation diffusion facilitator family transporter [Dehalococcoidia bacterium]|nr:cation diffusion facilitator family transporter [Dehalococcoidia bacterium]